MTTESEWSDNQRDRMLALGVFEAGICSCGYHILQTVPENGFEPKDRICPVCAGMAKFSRIRNAQESAKMGDKPQPNRDMPSDGRHTHMRLLSPEEKAARDEAASSQDPRRRRGHS